LEPKGPNSLVGEFDMPTVAYDHHAIKKLEIPESGTVDHPIEGRPGFGVRCSYGGTKSFYQKYRSPIEKIKKHYTIGSFPNVSLSEANVKRQEVIDAVEKGKDPQKEKMDEKEAAKGKALAVGPNPVTVKDGSYLYLNEHAKINCKSYPEIKRMFEKYVIPSIGSMRLDEIKRKHVMAMHRRIESKHGRSQADSAAGYTRTAFNWLHDKELAEDVPIFRFKAKKVKRTRTLEDHEIQAIWRDLDMDHQPNKKKLFGPNVKLLHLTGQRRNEVSGMRWSELDLENRVWSLPPERTKNGLPHLVPLSDAALAIIQDQDPIDGCDFVFTSNGKTQFKGYSRSKERLDKRVGFDDWVLHDLRRTFVTGVNNIGVFPHIVEACVNHVSGPSKGGVAGVYNKAQYWPERVNAMNRWADHVAAIVAGTADSNVVPFQGEAK
jgi:integrase